MNIEKKAVRLPHFVTIENLSNDDVSALIERAEYFKHGGTPENVDESGVFGQYVF